MNKSYKSFIWTKKDALNANVKKLANDRKLTTEEFINKANIIHNNKYNYSKVKYDKSYIKVEIICPEHGSFWQAPNHHLSGEGCLICNSSKGELLIQNILNKYNIPFEREVTFKVDEIIKKKQKGI